MPRYRYILRLWILTNRAKHERWSPIIIIIIIITTTTGSLA